MPKRQLSHHYIYFPNREIPTFYLTCKRYLCWAKPRHINMSALYGVPPLQPPWFFKYPIHVLIDVFSGMHILTERLKNITNARRHRTLPTRILQRNRNLCIRNSNCSATSNKNTLLRQNFSKVTEKNVTITSSTWRLCQ